MPPAQPRRDFLKRLLALPLIGAPQFVSAGHAQLDFSVFPVAGFGFHEGPKVIRQLQPGAELRAHVVRVRPEAESWDALRVGVRLRLSRS